MYLCFSLEISMDEGSRGGEAVRRAITPRGVAFDELLGAPSRRYLASGYKRVDYTTSFEPVSIEDDGRLRVRGVGSARYPRDWSIRPSGAFRQAHLSSVDAVALGAAAVEEIAVSFPQSFDSSRVVIDEIAIKAGSRPTADLGAIPLDVSLRALLSKPRVELLVGGFAISLSLRFPERKPPLEGGVRPYQSGYRATSIDSRLLKVDMGTRSIVTEHRVSLGMTGGASGLEAVLWPHLTHVDNVVLFGQIAQVLAQVGEGVSRGSIDNLWMRRMSFSRTEAVSPSHFVARAQLASYKVIERGEVRLHSVQMNAQSEHGVNAVASFGFVTPR
jgi:hypothetical protein